MGSRPDPEPAIKSWFEKTWRVNSPHRYFNLKGTFPAPEAALERDLDHVPAIKSDNQTAIYTEDRSTDKSRQIRGQKYVGIRDIFGFTQPCERCTVNKPPAQLFILIHLSIANKHGETLMGGM